MLNKKTIPKLLLYITFYASFIYWFFLYGSVGKSSEITEGDSSWTIMGWFLSDFTISKELIYGLILLIIFISVILLSILTVWGIRFKNSLKTKQIHLGILFVFVFCLIILISANVLWMSKDTFKNSILINLLSAIMLFATSLIEIRTCTKTTKNN